MTITPADDPQSDLDSVNKLIDILALDYQFHLKLCGENRGNETLRRALVRSLFALFEGTVSALKTMILIRYNDGRCVLNPMEICLLREEVYDVGNNGAMITNRKMISLENNLPFTFRIFADKFAQKEFKLDKSGAGWQALKRLIVVRNQLMHPKCAEHLSVPIEVIGDIKTTNHWFRMQYLDLLDTISPGTKGMLT